MIIALGDAMLDIVMRSRRPVRRGGHSLMHAEVSAGGSAANFAVWAARLGAEVALMAKVGDDLVGRALLLSLAQEGVLSAVSTDEQTTGLTLALEESDGGRTMLAARGANAALSIDDLNWEMIDRADLVHVSGYSFLEDAPRGAAIAAMVRVKRHGGLVSLDPSAHSYLQRVGASAFLDLSKDADIFLPNLEEGRALTGELEPHRVLRALLERFPVVALKMGPDGAMAGAGSTTKRHRGFEVPVEDAAGAGDAFAAAFTVSWLAHRDLGAALREGNRIGASVVQTAGAQRFKAVPRDSLPRQ